MYVLWLVYIVYITSVTSRRASLPRGDAKTCNTSVNIANTVIID